MDEESQQNTDCADLTGRRSPAALPRNRGTIPGCQCIFEEDGDVEEFAVALDLENDGRAGGRGFDGVLEALKRTASICEDSAVESEPSGWVGGKITWTR